MRQNNISALETVALPRKESLRFFFKHGFTFAMPAYRLRAMQHEIAMRINMTLSEDAKTCANKEAYEELITSERFRLLRLPLDNSFRMLFFNDSQRP
jgi:hypothetical protein